MRISQPAQGAGKGLLIAAGIVGVMLVIVVIFTIARALRFYTIENNADAAAQESAAGMAPANVLLSQEEIDRQHAQYHPPAPVIPKVVAKPPEIVPTNREDREVVRVREKTKLDQKLVERLNRFVRENPNRDTRQLEAEIKKRANKIPAGMKQ
jgi:hypothetical protein